MASVQVYLPVLTGVAGFQASNHPHADITHPTFGTLTLPVTRPGVKFADATPEWVEVPRPGRDPLLLPRGNKLRKFTLEVVLFGPDPFSDQAEYLLTILNQMAYDRSPVTVNYGTLESGTFQITSLTAVSVTRRPEDNHITRAEVTIEMTATSSVPPAPGDPPPPPKPVAESSQAAATGGGAPARYTVVAGDTLWDIATKTYGSGLKWKDIADANGIDDPRSLQVGQELVLP